jgi:hypothetical protein
MSAREQRLDEIFGGVAVSTHCAETMRATLEEIVQLAVEIAREGREGRKIGTLFVVGDVDEVIARSRPLILDPLFGHPPELLDVRLPEFRETVKELAQLDGAFIVRGNGTFFSAGRYIDVDVSQPQAFLPGLGTRHAAAASITTVTRSIAVVVSQSSVVRVFARGEIRAEIIPELFLLQREQLFVREAEVRQVPEAGVTMALARSRESRACARYSSRSERVSTPSGRPSRATTTAAEAPVSVVNTSSSEARTSTAPSGGDMCAITSSCRASGFLKTMSSSPRSFREPTTSASDSNWPSRTTSTWEIACSCITSIAALTFWCAPTVTSSGGCPSSARLNESTSSIVGTGARRSRKPCSSIQLSS